MQSSAKPRVAFFGGTFDPPHLGHLAVARAARDGLQLDEVLFAPVGAQPLKPHGALASFTDRVEMTRLAIAGDRAFELSLADAPNAAGRPNYTLDTLRRLRAGLPAGTELFCLMGADSFRSLGEWHGAAGIPFAAALIVASRPGQQLDDLTASLPAGLALAPAEGKALGHSQVDAREYEIINAAGERARFYLLPDLDVEISASEVRAQLRNGEDGPGSSVPAAVARYIRQHGLYK